MRPPPFRRGHLRATCRSRARQPRRRRHDGFRRAVAIDRRTSPLPTGERRAQDGCASFAVATARATSSASERATTHSRLPSWGLILSNRAPVEAGTSRPPIRLPISEKTRSMLAGQVVKRGAYASRVCCSVSRRAESSGGTPEIACGDACAPHGYATRRSIRHRRSDWRQLRMRRHQKEGR